MSSPAALPGGERAGARERAVWAVLILLAAAAFAWTGHRMYLRWTAEDSYYSHGPLIPLVGLVLLFLKRHELAACPRRPSGWGMALLVPALLLHILATAWQVGFLSGFGLVAALMGLTWALFGGRLLRAAFFPLLFLVFMVPLPVELVAKVSFALKLLSARVAVAVADLLGVIAVRSGSIIRLETGTLVVDDVCSGLKYLISLTAFAALYAHLAKVKWWGKAALFLLSVPIAFVSNALRVVIMVLVGRFVSIESTQAWYFHDLFGFLLFIFAFCVLFGVESLMLGQWRLGRFATSGGAGERKAAEGDEPARPRELVRPSGRFSLTLCALMAVAAAGSIAFAWPRETAPAGRILGEVPLAYGDWQGVDHVLEKRVYEVLGSEDVLSRSYRDGRGVPVQLVVVIAQQARRRTHPPEDCLTGEGYRITQSQPRSVDLPAGGARRRIEVRELVLDRPSGDALSWYFFKSGDSLRTGYWAHQAGVAFSKVRHPDSADVLIRVDTRSDDGLAAARERLERFLAAACPDLLERLP